MIGDHTPDVVYYAMGALLVLSSLVATKLPLAKALKMVLAWALIFVGFFVIFAFRSDFLAFGQRLRAEATGTAITAGSEVRIPIADDGHFWVQASVNGHASRFLIDSGASITTLSHETAQNAGISESGPHNYVDTANGTATMIEANADKVELGPITRTDFPININDRDQTNVLGMNFLSSLSSWRVEGNYLILRS